LQSSICLKNKQLFILSCEPSVSVLARQIFSSSARVHVIEIGDAARERAKEEQLYRLCVKIGERASALIIIGFGSNAAQIRLMVTRLQAIIFFPVIFISEQGPLLFGCSSYNVSMNWQHRTHAYFWLNLLYRLVKQVL
jgi:hypothetical protein